MIRRRRCKKCFAPLLAACVLAACAREPVTVGVIVSGGVADAARLAALDHAPSDAPGDSLRLRVEQPAASSAAEPALAAAQRLVDAGVIAVVGHSNSAASLAGSQIYNAHGVVQIAPTTTASIYSGAGRWSFRLVPPDEVQARYLGRAAAQLANGGTIAILYQNDDYGHGLNADLRQVMDSLHVPVVLAGAYALDAANGVTGLELLLETVAERKPALVMWLGRQVPLDRALPELRRIAPGIQVLGSDALDTDIVFRNEGGTFTDLYFMRFWDPQLESPPPQIERRLGRVPDFESLLTYDAVSLVATAIRDGARSSDDVRLWLLSLGREREPFHGLTGAIEFQEDGDMLRPMRLARVTRAGVVDVPWR